MPKKQKKQKVSQGMAVAALLLNILILPGLGSAIAGRTKTGVWQIVLIIASLVLDTTIIGLIIGIPLGIGIWIWGLVTGIQLVKEAN